jgi:hypothetical protein
MTFFHISRKKAAGVKSLFSGRCEWCDRKFPFDTLILHLMVPDETTSSPAPSSPDPEKRFLLLCLKCHDDLHHIPLPYHLQKDLMRARPPKLRKAIREILGYVPAPYQPPGDFDLAEIYEECFSLRSLDLFRAGG